MSNFTDDQIVSFRTSERGDIELVSHTADDDCTITNRVDLGRDGSSRRWFILRELARREGCRIVDAKGKVLVR